MRVVEGSLLMGVVALILARGMVGFAWFEILKAQRDALKQRVEELNTDDG